MSVPEKKDPRGAATPPGEKETARQDHQPKRTTPRPDTKTGRVLRALADGGRFHRFQAEHRLHDHTLPSTISTIQAQTGLRVDRKTIVVPGYQGRPTACALYWLADDQRQRARAMLGIDQRGEV